MIASGLIEGVTAELINGNVKSWEVTIYGSVISSSYPYQKIVLHLDFPLNYAYEPPFIKFADDHIEHPIGSGNMCSQVYIKSEDWTYEMDTQSIITNFISFMKNPTEESIIKIIFNQRESLARLDISAPVYQPPNLNLIKIESSKEEIKEEDKNEESKEKKDDDEPIQYFKA